MAERMYKIVRFHQSDTRRARVMQKNLTLEKARKWCNDPESSSKTATKACHGDEKLIAKWEDQQKHWFDGFTEQ